MGFSTILLDQFIAAVAMDKPGKFQISSQPNVVSNLKGYPVKYLKSYQYFDLALKLPVSEEGHRGGGGADHHVLPVAPVDGGAEGEAAEEQVLLLRVRPLLQRSHRDGNTPGLAALSKGYPHASTCLVGFGRNVSAEIGAAQAVLFLLQLISK